MFKMVSREAVRIAIEQIIWSYWPIWGVPLVTAILGYTQDRPWDLLFLMVIGAAAITVVLLFFIGRWRSDQTTENKVRFGAPVIGNVSPDRSATPAMTAIQLGISIDNIAQFPMDVVIEEVRARIENRQPEKQHEKKTVSMEILGQLMHRTNGISLHDLIKPNVSLEGDFYCKIKYGRHGRTNREKEFSYAVLFTFDGDMVLQDTSITIVDPNEYLAGTGRVVWEIPPSRRGQEGGQAQAIYQRTPV